MAKKRGLGGTFIQRSRSKPSSEKAVYHDQLGAGRSRVKRPFFALTDEDEQVLTDTFLQRLDRALVPPK